MNLTVIMLISDTIEKSKSHRFHGKRDFKPEKFLRGGDVNR